MIVGIVVVIVVVVVEVSWHRLEQTAKKKKGNAPLKNLQHCAIPAIDSIQLENP